MRNNRLLDFQTVRFYPFSSRAGMWCFAVLLMAALALLYFSKICDGKIKDGILAKSMMTPQDMGCFILDRALHPDGEKPEVLIAGSSKNGLGVSTDILSQRFGRLNTVKCTIDSGSCWECLALLQKYPDDWDQLKILILDFSPESIQPHNYQNGNTVFLLESKNCDLPDDYIKTSSNILSFRKMDLYGLAMMVIRFRQSSTHESSWHKEYYRKDKKSIMAAYDARPKSEIEEERDKKSKEITDPFLVKTLYKLVEYCQKRNILLILDVMPARFQPMYNSGYFDFRDPNTAFSENGSDFIQLCEKLKSEKGVFVFGLASFKEIDPTVNEKELFFDTMHMTLEGAALYTNWLADQILSDPNTQKRLLP